MSAFDEIETSRMRLRLMPKQALKALAKRDIAKAASTLEIAPGEDLLELQRLANLRLKQIKADPHYHPWSLRALIRKHDNAMMGYCNFHARPGDESLARFGKQAVEIGYTVFPNFRRHGYAYEAVVGLLGWARARGADTLILSIAPNNVPSLGIAAKLGAVKVDEQIDDEDGLEFVFRLNDLSGKPSP